MEGQSEFLINNTLHVHGKSSMGTLVSCTFNDVSTYDCYQDSVHTLSVLVVCVVLLELMISVTYTPSHSVVEKVMSPV